jgi:hypothetical protein
MKLKGKGEVYKFLRLIDGKIVSEHGEQVWEVGKKYSVEGKIECCRNGYHASDTPLDALNYVNGEVLAICEGSGNSDIQSDKSVWQNMTVTKAYKWQKVDSVALAIYCAKKVIGIYEAKYPGDNRPRNAIDAAKKWLAEQTKENENAADAAAYAAACAACAAYAAADAADAADAACAAACAAARAAYAAACAAARAACAAAYAAARAAYDAETRNEINAWMVARVAELEEIV